MANSKHNGRNIWGREGHQTLHFAKIVGRNNGGEHFHLRNTYNAKMLCIQKEGKRKGGQRTMSFMRR